MKTPQKGTIYSPKQRGYRFWLIRLALLLGLTLLLYYGYCWGILGRNSLLLQYLFQCSCPSASEEARYPRRVEVIVSACRNINASIRISPSGRFLYLREQENEIASAYFLDLQTMERITVPNQSFSSFLTDDLWFVESGVEDDVIDRTTGKQYTIQTFRNWRENAYVNGEPNLELLVSTLHQSKQIFLTLNNDTVIVLMSDFPTNLEQNFTFDRSDIPGSASNRVEQFLRENNIVYQTVLADFPGEAISPNGRFIARQDGIFLFETEQKIVNGYSSSRFYRPYSRKYFSVRGWTYDGTGVIYSKFLNPCLVETNFLFGDDIGCFYEVHQPVLLLKVPEEYLLPTETP